VTITADDGNGGVAEVYFVLQVNNVPPTIASLIAPADPVEVGTPITAHGQFTDPGVDDTHTAQWDWGDTWVMPGTVTESGGSGSVTDMHTYDTPGVYTVSLTVIDNDGGVATSIYQYVVVYDPEGGFVTGGGWIDSPEGAFPADPLLTGRANFGFVSKYRRGASTPTGNTQFRFQAADLNFHSTSYQWLVIAHHKAMYKGDGEINGQSGYGFMISAVDGEIPGGGGSDKFRIKIWDLVTETIVYDNQIGDDDDADPTTVIGGGSIVIHNN
jgi:hypothetical protein